MIIRGPSFNALAFDRSLRTLDLDGRMHVEFSRISKANVCPYRGGEIPGCEELGLDPDRIYQLLRDPEELEKAAPTFNNVPLLIKHVPHSAEAPVPDLVVGSTGTDAIFDAPYLYNSLVIWTQDGIEGVENNKRRELSCSYRYTADMTPGEYKGLRYDGIMRNIIANHVALVPEGRAGPDVLVSDGQMEKSEMLKTRKALLVSGALAAYLKPRLAADAKVDLSPVLAGVTRANFGKRKAGIVKAVLTATKGRLAADASVEDVVEFIDALEDVTDGEVDEDTIAEAAQEAGAEGGADPDQTQNDADGDKIAELMAFLKTVLSDEDMAKAAELAGAGAGEAPPEGGANDKPLTKTAMDAAIQAAEARTVARMNAMAQAKEDVRPLVGTIKVAMDSAEAVYKFALDSAKVPTKGVHPSAFRAMVAMLPKPGTRTPARVAEDAAPTDAPTFAERFPTAALIKV